MFDSLKPGQIIKCTLTSAPRASGNKTTLQRLMRLDPASVKSLRRAYRLRAQRMTTYNRGNRDWVKRETCAKIVTVGKGQSWTMPYSVNLLPDLKSIEKFIKVEKA